MGIQSSKPLEHGALPESVGLSRRLQAIATLVPQGARLIDVGTDHALLPISLLQQQQITAAIAVDRAQKPLQQAALHRAQANISPEQLELVHADGIRDIDIRGGDVVVIAGMGGKTIRSILETAHRTPLEMVITQANRSVSEMRAFLGERGWRIDQEHMIIENNQHYPIVVWNRGEEPLSPKQAFLGPHFLRHRPPEWIRWLEWQQKILVQVQEKAGQAMPTEKQQALHWVTEALSC